MKRDLTTYATVCLLTSGLSYTSSSVAFASSAQSTNRTAQESARTPRKTADAHPVQAKPAQEASVAKVTQKKDAPGKRFWGRIMDHFRDIHSAEKKPK
jgi:hypothetical protein